MDLNIPDSTNDSGARGDVDLGGTCDHVYIVYAMRITTTPSQGLATQKTTIFRNGGNAPNQFGEMNQIDGRLIWNWLFTDPNKGNIDLTAFGDISAILGQWHTYKLELDSRGPGTKVVFGRDGVDHMITLTTTNAPAGLPDAISVGGTLNGGSGPSHVEFDDIHVGTVDPGWP
jgi:hypothetical protein